MKKIQCNRGHGYRLRLWHVFLWVFASALVPAAYQAMYSPHSAGIPGFSRELIDRLVQVSTLAMALISPVHGAYIAGTVILLSYSYSHRHFVLQPGHVFLLIGCGSLAVGMAANLVNYVVISPAADSTLTFYVLGLLIHAFESVAYVSAARFAFDSRWRYVFRVMAALMAFDAAIATVGIIASVRGGVNPIYYVSSWFDEAVSIGQTTLILSLLFFSGFQDVCRSTARDWMHWVGILCIALDQVISCIGDIVFAVVQQVHY